MFGFDLRQGQVLVLSIAAVGLLYWLIRRPPATGFASLFYLVPAVTAFFAFILFDERLDSISMLGMVICAGGVVLVNRGTSSPSNMAAQSRSKRSQASSPKSG